MLSSIPEPCNPCPRSLPLTASWQVCAFSAALVIQTPAGCKAISIGMQSPTIRLRLPIVPRRSSRDAVKNRLTLETRPNYEGLFASTVLVTTACESSSILLTLAYGGLNLASNSTCQDLIVSFICPTTSCARSNPWAMAMGKDSDSGLDRTCCPLLGSTGCILAT